MYKYRLDYLSINTNYTLGLGGIILILLFGFPPIERIVRLLRLYEEEWTYEEIMDKACNVHGRRWHGNVTLLPSTIAREKVKHSASI